MEEGTAGGSAVAPPTDPPRVLILGRPGVARVFGLAREVGRRAVARAPAGDSAAEGSDDNSVVDDGTRGPDDGTRGPVVDGGVAVARRPAEV